ncbi:pro-Pol polyprotein [Trichonephila clavipes]|nr:pro-Pol polyprotein [Trichonephila clavipes]
MVYLGKGRREDLFVLATELNLKFDKSMTIATLKDLIISSEDYDEELTKNIHSTVVEDRKAREENLRIEEQKEKLPIEEREEKLRFEQLSGRIYQIYLAISVKTVSAESALEKLKQQQKTFGNPIRIISDRGSAFTSKLFNDYCDEENIQHLQIATGVPRGNGQVERIPRTLIPVLTKLSLDDSTKWYKYVDRLQIILNSTISRSTKWTPFELLVGIKMRNKEDILIKDLLLEEMANELLDQREFFKKRCKKNIKTLQSENRKTYNRRRKKASLYK